MTDLKPPLPAELHAILKETGLTHSEMGAAIGYGDAERTIRALVKGQRHQKPYTMTSTAAHAMRYMLALAKVVAAYRHADVSTMTSAELELAQAIDEASATLPKRMQRQ